jgi:hypothetical protein
MKATRCPRRTRPHWTALVMLCGALGGLSAAAQADETKLYTVIGVPLSELSSFEQANISPGFDGQLQAPANTLRTLHVSGDVATVSITRKDDPEKWTLHTVYFPINPTGSIPPLFQEINPFDSFSNGRVIGSVIQVEVSQADPGQLDLSRARFMLAPNDQVRTLQLMNSRVNFKAVHVQRATTSMEVLPAVLLAIDKDDARGIQIPNEPLASTILALNSNVSVQQVQGQGFYQITTIAVN